MGTFKDPRTQIMGLWGPNTSNDLVFGPLSPIVCVPRIIGAVRVSFHIPIF